MPDYSIIKLHIVFDTEQKAEIVRKGAYHGQTAAQNEKPDIYGVLRLA